MATEAGWYSDGSTPNALRYWDGHAWTERTKAVARGDRVTPPGWYSDGVTDGALRFWDGLAWTEQTKYVSERAAPTDARATVQEPAVAASDADRHPIGQPAAIEPADEAPAASSASDGVQASVPSALEAEVGESAPVSRTTRSERVGIFGARKAATGALERVAELESVIERYDLTDVLHLEDQKRDLKDEVVKAGSELARVQTQLNLARAEVQQAREELVDVRAAVELQEFGLFDFENPAEESNKLATRLESVRQRIKEMVRSGGAAHATSGFTFNNSAAKGRKFVADMTKILLRAYNAEAENCVKTVRAGSLAAAQTRLTKAAEQIARQGSMIDLKITPAYHALRLEEIELANSHLLAVQREREAERERRAELREQRKAEAELRAERDRLEKERDHYEGALKLLLAKGDEEGAARLREQLEDVQRAMNDVDYRAANIRAGYVYVISNVGAFGDRMVKIGMTRRLEPMDRINELGDASVPFRFDVHALFFATDAVSIETMLHQTFAAERVNRVNLRREFFYATPEQVLEVLREKAVEVVEYRTEAEAAEYRSSTTLAASQPAPEFAGG